MSTPADTLIILTTGKQDRGTRATLAFAWGCAALAMGQSVTMYLTMDGTVWATIGAMKGVQVGGFEPLEDYLEQFLALDGQLLACAPCTEYYCAMDRDTIPGVLIEETQLSGLATIVSLMGDHTRTVTL
jgi:predicted peroxiredoxin